MNSDKSDERRVTGDEVSDGCRVTGDEKGESTEAGTSPPSSSAEAMEDRGAEREKGSDGCRVASDEKGEATSPRPSPPRAERESGIEKAKGRLWEQQAGETGNAFADFREYLDLGPEATYEEVANRLGKSVASVAKMSSRYRWPERAAAWRRHLAQIECAAMEAVTVKAAALSAVRISIAGQEFWEVGGKMLQVGRLELNKHLTNQETETSLFHISRLVEVGAKLAQLSAQLGENTPGQIEGRKGGMSIEFAQALRMVYGAAVAAGLPDVKGLLLGSEGEKVMRDA